ncbi:hypothetical protein MMC26_000553 [Xylographa opegraphella]|nr:hypothetical protein [Xylographa opegraphella]
MTRAQQTISIGLLVSSLYLACFLQLIPFSAKVQDEIIPVVGARLKRRAVMDAFGIHADMVAVGQLPFWALVSFGSYLLFKLGLGVFTFKDVPEAYRELMREIEVARKDLKSKGIDVD